MNDKHEVNGQTITMTYGLLNECVREVGDVDQLAEIHIDQELRNALLVIVLSERDDEGRIEKPVNLHKLELSVAEVQELLDWIGEHVADFFIGSLERTKKLLTDRGDRMMALMPSSSGGEA